MRFRNGYRSDLDYDILTTGMAFPVEMTTGYWLLTDLYIAYVSHIQ